jgi:hypothetical protein
MNSSIRRVPPPAHSILAVLLRCLFTAPGTLTLITTPPLPAASQISFQTLRFPSHAPRDTRRLSLTSKYCAELATETQVFLTLLIKLVSGEAEAGEIRRPGWMRVLAMEIMRGCVFVLLLSLIVPRL